MARWNPVVFRRCECQGACPPALRFEPAARTRAALHVLVHRTEPAVPALPALRPAPAVSLPAVPFLLLGAAALLLATLEGRR
jgi:hypothetical protein